MRSKKVGDGSTPESCRPDASRRTRTWAGICGLGDRGRRPWIALATLVLLGCGGDQTRFAGKSDAVRARAFPAKLVQISSVDHTAQQPVREPMIVEHPDGTLFVAGWPLNPDPDTTPRLWKRDSGDQPWESVEVGTEADGAKGNSDVDLAIGPNGTLYYAVMGFSWEKGHGTHIAIGASPDKGKSWRWTSLSDEEGADRPWVAVAPDGRVHVVWNDGAAGPTHAISTDGGTTWEQRSRVHPAGTPSHLAIGPAGELAVRITPLTSTGFRPDEVPDMIAVSNDCGKNWGKHAAPGSRDWDPTLVDATKIPRWVEPVAWDAGGALYTMWSEGDQLMLGRSKDLGTSWITWLVADDQLSAYYPYLIARGTGELAATWFSGRGEDLKVNVALIRAPTGDNDGLLVARADPFQQKAWSESWARPGTVSRDTAGEYVPVVFLGDFELGMVTTLQDVRGDWNRGYEFRNNRQGFTWRRFDGR